MDEQRDIFLVFFTHFAPEVKQVYGEQTVYVLLDNCRALPGKEILDSLYPNIKVWMLPPNTTALIQPMDMGIIYSAKARFKKTYYDKLIAYDITQSVSCY